MKHESGRPDSIGVAYCLRCKRKWPCSSNDLETRVERVRELARSARAAVSKGPADCTNNCNDGPCDCSGVFRAMGWDLDPAVVLVTLDGEDDE